MFGKEKRKNKIIFLKKCGKVFQIVGRKYIDPIATEFKYKDGTFTVPKAPNYLNKHGKLRFFVDIDTGIGIPLAFPVQEKPTLSGKGKKGKGKQKMVVPTFSPKEVDLFLRKGLIQGFIRSFSTIIRQDRLLLLFTLGTGIAIGYIAATVIMKLQMVTLGMGI